MTLKLKLLFFIKLIKKNLFQKILLGPCKIIGFGSKRHAGLPQEQLHEGEVYVISNKHCRLLLGYVWAPQKGDNTVCALGNEQDTCQVT